MRSLLTVEINFGLNSKNLLSFCISAYYNSSWFIDSEFLTNITNTN